MSGLWEPAEHAFPVDGIDEFLMWAAESGASDVAFQTGSAVSMEVDGRLVRATAAAVDKTAMEYLVERLFNATGDGILRSGQAIDCSVTVQESRERRQRFRVNISPVQVDHGFGVNISLRVMPGSVPSIESLGIESEIVEAWKLCAGLTLVTGIPGSGKSTLLAAGTRMLLEEGAGRIQSFEAPIEFVFDGIGGDGSMMSQSEIPRHFESFSEGLRSSLRRRPAAVVVGEARDRETVEAVVRASDYGIAVFSTAHTSGVAATVRRLLSEFPADERRERGAALIDALNLVVTQVLVEGREAGRCALREWLVFGADLKRELLEIEQEQWPSRVAAEVLRRGSGLSLATARAFDDGLIGEAVRARLIAAHGELSEAGAGGDRSMWHSAEGGGADPYPFRNPARRAKGAGVSRSAGGSVAD